MHHYAGSYPRTLLHLLIFAATLRACSAFAPTILVRFTTGRESGAQEQGLGLSRGAFSRVSSHSCSGGRAVDTLGHGQQARLSLTGGGTSIGRRQTLARMCTTKREESAESADANDANARNLDGNPVPNEVQMEGYSTAATVWVIAAALHLLSFSLLNPATWTTRAVFSLAFSHFMLWLLSIRSLITATAEGLEASSIFQQLNLALVTSSLLATVVAITKFLTKGVVEVAVPATLVLASAATTLVATRVWFDAITTTHHLRSPNMALSATDQGVMAFLEGLSSSLSTFLSPRRIDGLCYRFIALLFALQAALALLHPAALLSLLHLSPPFVDRQDVAMAAWAPALLFQACAAFALACQGDKERLSETVCKDLNAGMVHLSVMILLLLFVVTVMIQVLLLAGSAADSARHLVPAIPSAFPPKTLAYLALGVLIAIFCVLKHPPPKNLFTPPSSSSSPQT